MLTVLSCCASLVVLQEPPVERVSVELESSGCFHHEAQQYEWMELVGLRKAIAESRHEVPGLLAELGVTPQSFAAHRDEIVAQALPAAYRGEAKTALPPELEPLLAWERRPRAREARAASGDDAPARHHTRCAAPPLVRRPRALVPPQG